MVVWGQRHWKRFGLETVVYDNFFDQAIAGGSIIVHAKK